MWTTATPGEIDMDVCEKSVGSFKGILQTRILALAALLLFVADATAQSGSNTIVVRARGAAGGESITPRVDNSNVATWTLTASYQTFNATTNLNGAAIVAFTNDGGSRDAQIDYIIVN